MGTFSCPITITDMDDRHSEDIEAVVDTGAAYTTLPSSLLRRIGVEPSGKRTFLVADGRQVTMEIGQAWVTLNDDSVVTVVVFGEDGAPPLLGAYTLEGLALAVDPIAQRLVPTHMILY